MLVRPDDLSSLEYTRCSRPGTTWQKKKTFDRQRSPAADWAVPATVRPALWPGDVEYDLSYVAVVQPTPNSRGERALYVRALTVTKKVVFFQKHFFSKGNPVVNIRYFVEF